MSARGDRLFTQGWNSLCSSRLLLTLSLYLYLPTAFVSSDFMALYKCYFIIIIIFQVEHSVHCVFLCLSVYNFRTKCPGCHIVDSIASYLMVRISTARCYAVSICQKLRSIKMFFVFIMYCHADNATRYPRDSFSDAEGLNECPVGSAETMVTDTCGVEKLYYICAIHSL